MEEAQTEIKLKIKEVSQKAVKVTKVLLTLCRIGLIISIVSAILTAVVYFGFLSNSIQLGRVNIMLLPFDIDITSKAAYSQIVKLLVRAILYLVFNLIMLKKFKEAFQFISESTTPFCNEVVSRFKLIFILATIMCFISSIATGLIVGFILLCIYYILKYGVMLQNESNDK